MLQFGQHPQPFSPPLFVFVIPILIVLIYAFVIYVLITFVRFMKKKSQTDEELLKRLDRLIDLHEKHNE